MSNDLDHEFNSPRPEAGQSKRPAPGKYDVVDPNYRGYAVDPTTGQPLDPFRLRDRRNAKSNPKPGTHQAPDPDAPWGCD